MPIRRTGTGILVRIPVRRLPVAGRSGSTVVGTGRTG
jgi:hypothetical protein